MTDDTPAALGALRVDEGKLRGHVDEVVRSSVEETLNGLLDAEADQICQAHRERSADRVDTRAGHYERKLETKAGEVTLKVPKLRRLPFETAIIERYKRREASAEEALVEMYLAGVSVRRVEDITEALWGTRVSSGTVSRLNHGLAPLRGHLNFSDRGVHDVQEEAIRAGVSATDDRTGSRRSLSERVVA